jgi:ligand-binding sensor domain-containing protein
VSAVRRWLIAAAQFLLGVALVSGVGLAVRQLLPEAEPVLGWLTIRPPRDVMALLEVPDESAVPWKPGGQTIWSGGREGVAVLDRDTGQFLRWVELGDAAGSLELEYVTSLAMGPGDQGSLTAIIWVGHHQGLSYRPWGQLSGPGTWQTLTAEDGLPSNEVLALLYSARTGLWVGTRGGLAHLRQGSPPEVDKVYTHADGLAGDAASVLLEDRQGRLWVGGGYANQPGLSMFDGEGWTVFTTADGLAHDMVNAILEDMSGNLWFGAGFSSRGGATRYDGLTWSTLDFQEGGDAAGDGSRLGVLAGAKVRYLFLDREGALWFGSEYDGIARQHGEDWQLFTPKEGLAGWEVKAMLQDAEGYLWLGTENGLSRLDPSVLQTGLEGTCRYGP